LVDPLTPVTVPFDDCVVFVGLLDCAEFSSRLSKVPQTFYTISRIHFFAGSRGFHEGWFLGAIRVSDRPGM
jgi:hypothetical protein